MIQIYLSARGSFVDRLPIEAAAVFLAARPRKYRASSPPGQQDYRHFRIEAGG